MTETPMTAGMLKLPAMREAAGISWSIPAFQDLLLPMLELTPVVLGWVGSAAPVIAWVVWGLGVTVTLIVALGLTLAVRLIHKPSARPA